MPDPSARTRTKVLYLTLDVARDHGDPSSLAGLTAAAKKWGNSPSLAVEHAWFGDVCGLDADALDERHQPFMLFLTGTATDWQEYGRNPEWARMVDAWSALVKTTSVPIMAVCGGHQLLARTYGNGWDAIGHMVGESSPDISIRAELAASPPRDLTPSPRLAELGTFPLVVPRWAEDDPLFARGLGSRVLHFTESHVDQVLRKGIGFQLVELLGPARDEDALEIPGARPLAPRDRCKVQALRWVGDERVIYSLQFHPELIIHPDFLDSARTPLEVKAEAEALGTDGETLLLNFFDIAADYWST